MQQERATLLLAAASAAAGVAAFLWSRRAGASSFGAALVAAAVDDLGVVEDLGKNDGLRIREYFRGSGIDPPQPWCAAAVTFWIRRAARALGVPPPISGSLKAKDIAQQIVDAAKRGKGRWWTAEELRRDPSVLQVGDVVVWDRSDRARPETSWFGHVGIVAQVAADAFGTIEGNSGAAGDRVARMRRTVRDPRLIGAGRVW